MERDLIELEAAEDAEDALTLGVDPRGPLTTIKAWRSTYPDHIRPGDEADINNHGLGTRGTHTRRGKLPPGPSGNSNSQLQEIGPRPTPLQRTPRS